MERFIEFARTSQDLRLLNGPYPVTVEVLLAHQSMWRRLARRPSWNPLVSFLLHTELAKEEGRERFIARTHDPLWRP